MGQSTLIELKSVRKDYRTGDETLHALDGVNLSIKPGEFIAIIGPSGSGKSTLANIIGGLDKPDAGTVRSRGGSGQSLRQGVIKLPQQAHWFRLPGLQSPVHLHRARKRHAPAGARWYGLSKKSARSAPSSASPMLV
jgi:ABC-type nitrate/sulfonate/bicarbonate transport system ATPase subunit